MLARPSRIRSVRWGTRWIGRGSTTSTIERASNASHSAPTRKTSSERTSPASSWSRSASRRVHSSRYSGGGSRSKSCRLPLEKTGQLRQCTASNSLGQERSPCTPMRRQHASATLSAERASRTSDRVMAPLPAQLAEPGGGSWPPRSDHPAAPPTASSARAPRSVWGAGREPFRKRRWASLQWLPAWRTSPRK